MLSKVYLINLVLVESYYNGCFGLHIQLDVDWMILVELFPD